MNARNAYLTNPGELLCCTAQVKPCRWRLETGWVISREYLAVGTVLLFFSLVLFFYFALWYSKPRESLYYDKFTVLTEM